jgi:putative membrane protein
VSARFLDDEARRAFKKAIEAIETASSMEVVVAVRRRSERYLHANVIVGVAAAFAGLALMLYSDYEFGLMSILIDPFVVGGVAGALVELLPSVKRVLTPARIRRFHVERAARSAFVERGVHNTRDRSGVLLYVSWLEQIATLVPDSGIVHEIAAADLVKDAEAITREVSKGGAAVARALEARILAHAPAMPRRPDDVNELPDDIDSDMSRTSMQRAAEADPKEPAKPDPS